MAGLPGEQAVPPAQFPQSNAMQKVNMGGQPDPLMSALNAFITQMSGTDYNMGSAATETVAPPRQPGGVMPGGMMIQPGIQPPVPEPNPMFHPQSPIEYDLGALLRGAMMPTGQPSTFIPSNMMAMGDENATIPDAGGDPNAKAASSKPQKVKPKPAKKGSPERAKPKGEEPKNEPKQVTPPPRKKMLARK